MADLLGEIKEHIERREAVVVAGAGIAAHATARARLASWKGLLEHGAERAAAVQPEFRANRYRLALQEIASDDLENLCSAAGKIERALGGRSSDEFRRWMSESVGTLQILGREVLASLLNMGTMLATLHYDTLLESTTGLRAVTWRDGAAVERTGRGDEPGVLHPFGCWQKPESVLLGVRSYRESVGESHADNVARAIGFKKAVVFVGCRPGHDDPHFEVFLSWLTESRRIACPPLYSLVTNAEMAAGVASASRSPVTLVPYGERDADLVDCLRRLAPPVDAAPSVVGMGAGSGDSSTQLVHCGSVSSRDGSNGSLSRWPIDDALLRGAPPDGRAPRFPPPGSSLQTVAPAVLSPSTSSCAPAPALPERPSCLGRDAEVLALVDEALRPAPRPMIVLGPPGIGKSTIVLDALHEARLVARYANRRFFVPCDGAASAEAVAVAIGSKLGIRASRQIRTAVTARLGEEPTLLVLDHLEVPWNQDTARVEDLLGMLVEIPGLCLTGTSCSDERPLLPAWADSIRLRCLPLEAARRVFLGIAGDALAADPDLDGLLSALDCVPLAVAFVARAVCPDEPLRDVLGLWRDRRASMLQEQQGSRAGVSAVAVALELLLASAHVTPEALRLLSILSTLPGGASLSDLEQLVPEADPSTLRLVRNLGFAQTESGRLRLSCTVRTLITARHRPGGDDARRAESFYVQRLLSGGYKLDGPNGRAIYGGLAAEAVNIEALLCLAASRPAPLAPETLHALGAWAEYLARAGLGTTAPIVSAGASLQSASDRVGAARCDEALAAVALSRAQHDEARSQFERALVACREGGSVEGEAVSLLGLARIEHALRHEDPCTEICQQALQAFRRIAHTLGEAGCLRVIGEMAVLRGRHDEAQEALDKALALYRGVEHSAGEAACLLLLGDAASERTARPNDVQSGDVASDPWDEARMLYEQALPVVRRTADFRGEVRCLRNLARLSMRVDKHDIARQYLEEALALCREAGDVTGEATCAQTLAKLETSVFHDEAGRKGYDRALRLHRHLGDLRGEAHCAQLLGSLALKQAKYREARRWYEMALPRYRQVGPTLGEANCIQVLGSLFFLDKEYEQARRHYEQALELYRQLGDILGEANCLRGLGEVAAARSDLVSARARYQDALTLYECIPDPYSIGAARMLLARAAEKPEERLAHIQEARSAWQSIARTDMLRLLEKEFGAVLTMSA